MQDTSNGAPIHSNRSADHSLAGADCRGANQSVIHATDENNGATRAVERPPIYATSGAGLDKPRGRREQVKRDARALADWLDAKPVEVDGWWALHRWKRNHRRGENWESASGFGIDVDFERIVVDESNPGKTKLVKVPLPEEIRERLIALADAGAMPGNMFHFTRHGFRIAFILAADCADREQFQRAADMVNTIVSTFIQLHHLPTPSRDAAGLIVDAGVTTDLARCLRRARCNVLTADGGSYIVDEPARVIRDDLVPIEDLFALADAAHGAESTPHANPLPSGNAEPPDELDTVCLADIEPEEIRWIWRFRIPAAKLTLIEGDPSAGKGWLQAYMIACITTGDPWPDCFFEKREPGNVVVLQIEDGWADTIRPRLDAVRADVRRVFAIRGKKLPDGSIDPALNIRDDVGKLEAEIRKRNAAVAFIDPVTAYLPENVDSHRDADVRRVMSLLADLSERTGCAIICIRHLNKQTGGKALYRGGGSIAFTALARAVWRVAPDVNDEERRLFLPVKLNIQKKPSGLAYRIDNGVTFELDPVTVSADDAEYSDDGTTASTRQEAQEWLLAALEDGPVPSNEIYARAKRDGFSPRTLERAKAALKIESRKADGIWKWFPPNDLAKPATDDGGEVGDLAGNPHESSDCGNIANIATAESGGLGDDGQPDTPGA